MWEGKLTVGRVIPPPRDPGKCFLRVGTRGGPEGANVVMCKWLPGSTGFEDMKGLWRADELWHQERPLVKGQKPQGGRNHGGKLRLGTRQQGRSRGREPRRGSW